MSIKEKITSMLKDTDMQKYITSSFEEAKNNDRRKNIVLVDDAIYLTFKVNTDREDNVFGEIASWVEDEFIEDESVYQSVYNWVTDIYQYSDKEINLHILDDGGSDEDLSIPFTRYDGKDFLYLDNVNDIEQSELDEI